MRRPNVEKVHIASCHLNEVNISHNNFNMCVFMMFFLHPVVIVCFETIFKQLKVVGSQIRLFQFNHISLCGKVWFMFMTGHDIAMAGEFEFERI